MNGDVFMRDVTGGYGYIDVIIEGVLCVAEDPSQSPWPPLQSHGAARLHRQEPTSQPAERGSVSLHLHL